MDKIYCIIVHCVLTHCSSLCLSFFAILSLFPVFNVLEHYLIVHLVLHFRYLLQALRCPNLSPLWLVLSLFKYQVLLLILWGEGCNVIVVRITTCNCVYIWESKSEVLWLWIIKGTSKSLIFSIIRLLNWNIFG